MLVYAQMTKADALPPDFFAPTKEEVWWHEYQEHLERKMLLEYERMTQEATGFADWQLDWMPQKYEAYTAHY